MWRVASPLVAYARSGSSSHASTAVHAAGWITKSARVAEDGLEDGRTVGDVEAGVVTGDDVVAVEGADDLAPDEARRARDQDLHRQTVHRGVDQAVDSWTGARSRSGSHQSRCASYQATVAASPASKSRVGAHPSSARIFVQSRT